MALITVKPGRREGAFDGPDDVYPVVLVGISGPRTIIAQHGARAGQEMDLLDWTFSVLDGPCEGQLIDGSTSTASGPSSRMYEYLTALLGGKAPAIGSGFEVDDLVGRVALATISRDQKGWPRIENLGALPASMRPARQAEPEPAPAPAPATPAPAARPSVRQHVNGSSADDLSF